MPQLALPFVFAKGQKKPRIKHSKHYASPMAMFGTEAEVSCSLRRIFVCSLFTARVSDIVKVFGLWRRISKRVIAGCISQGCIMLNMLKHFSYSVVSSIKRSSLVGEKSARLGLHGSH
jgi:hypothetical protein